MDVAIHVADRTAFPNLALMKISAWHRGRGDRVSRFSPFVGYDRVYSSKVFTFTPDDPFLPLDAVRGGSGYGPGFDLPGEVEHTRPDYDLYGDGDGPGMGFLTRGCRRRCPWCIVPRKEGTLRAHAEFEEFRNPATDRLVLLDNDVLASDHGTREIERMTAGRLRVDFNQGLDARRIGRDDAVARLLARVRWYPRLRLACDTKAQMPHVERAVTSLRTHGCHAKIACYVLVQDIDDALDRVEFLRKLKVDPFAQPYRDPAAEPGSRPDQEHIDFARWVNRKELFKAVPWKDYRRDYRRGRRV